MDKKNRNVVVLSLLSVLLTITAVSYAYIRKTTVQTSNNEINTLTCLAFEMTNKEGKITLTNAYPIPDAEGLEGTPYSFTVTNKCNTPIVVDIGMQTIGTGLNKNYIKYAIDDGTNKPGIFTIGSKPTKTVKVDNTNVTINVLDKVYLDANTAEDQDTSTVEVDNDTPSEGARRTYNLRLWIDEATTWEQAHDGNNTLNYTGKIVLAASPTKGRYIPEFSAETGTLLAAIKNGNYEFLNPLTTPGKEINSYSESLIAKTEDDYGTSYYFRGNVQNNYVIFANKCWKILRIDGQGNTKLFYWGNEVDGTCTNNSNAYDSIAFNNKRVEGETNPGKDYSGRIEAYTFNRPAGVGFMYGEPMAETYQGIDSETEKPNGAQDNIYDSTILLKLKEFYRNNIISNTTSGNLENYLADVIWCGDKSLDKVNATGNGWEFGTNTFFGARARVYANGVANAKPSLVCPEAGTDGKLSKYTAADTTNGNGMLKGTNGVGETLYKIGLITADEAAFAGGAYNTANNSYYLWTNSYYWTLSPYSFSAGYHLSSVWRVYTTGHLNNNYVTSGLGVRPAVSLKSTATISGGTGTATNPYIINGV